MYWDVCIEEYLQAIGCAVVPSQLGGSCSGYKLVCNPCVWVTVCEPRPFGYSLPLHSLPLAGHLITIAMNSRGHAWRQALACLRTP